MVNIYNKFIECITNNFEGRYEKQIYINITKIDVYSSFQYLFSNLSLSEILVLLSIFNDDVMIQNFIRTPYSNTNQFVVRFLKGVVEFQLIVDKKYVVKTNLQLTKFLVFEDSNYNDISLTYGNKVRESNGSYEIIFQTPFNSNNFLFVSRYIEKILNSNQKFNKYLKIAEKLKVNNYKVSSLEFLSDKQVIYVVKENINSSV